MAGDGGILPPVDPGSNGNDNYGSHNEIIDVLNAYKDNVGKYGQALMKGDKSVWDKMDAKNPFIDKAKTYIKESGLYGDGKAIYEGLQGTGRFDTLMGMALKGEYGEPQVVEAMNIVSKETLDTFEGYRAELAEKEVTGLANLFGSLGAKMSNLYHDDPAAFLFVEGMYSLSQNAEALKDAAVKQLDDFGQKLEEMQEMIEKLGERYGPLT